MVSMVLIVQSGLSVWRYSHYMYMYIILLICSGCVLKWHQEKYCFKLITPHFELIEFLVLLKVSTA